MSSKEISHHNWAAIPLETLSPLLDRKLITGDGMMVAQVFLKKGCVVPRHQHHNEQFTYILQGGLRFFLGEEGEAERTQDVMAGEVLHIPAWKWHKAEALEDTLDVDIFSPPREDWINKTDSYLREPAK